MKLLGRWGMKDSESAPATAITRVVLVKLAFTASDVCGSNGRARRKQRASSVGSVSLALATTGSSRLSSASPGMQASLHASHSLTARRD